MRAGERAFDRISCFGYDAPSLFLVDIMPLKIVQCMLMNPLRNPYSPECVEEGFCELRLDGVLGSSA